MTPALHKTAYNRAKTARVGAFAPVDRVQRLFSARSCRFRADYLLEIAQPPVEELV